MSFGAERLTHPRAQTRGFTLAETVVALGVMTILLVGMGGAITMSVTALDRGQDKNSDAADAADAADQFLGDLGDATALLEASSTSITFEAPDRDDDGLAETIEYSWAGAGTPLKRSYNGEGLQTLIANVADLRLDFTRRQMATTTGAEQVLISFDSSVTATDLSQDIRSSKPAAQYLKPPFDAGVTSWSITRLSLRLARDSSPTGTLRISLVLNDQWAPKGAVLGTITLSEASLPGSFGWVNVPVSAGPINPSQGVFILLEEVSGSGAGTVQYGQSGATMPYNTYFTTGTTSGTWDRPNDSKDMRFIAYGTITSK